MIGRMVIHLRFMIVPSIPLVEHVVAISFLWMQPMNRAPLLRSILKHAFVQEPP